MSLIEDSDRRCARCGKRMMVEIGQDDNEKLVLIHQCWCCGYSEREEQWKRPSLRLVPKRSAAERIRLQRLGEVPSAS